MNEWINKYHKPCAFPTASCRVGDRQANKNHSLSRGARGKVQAARWLADVTGDFPSVIGLGEKMNRHWLSTRKSWFNTRTHWRNGTGPDRIETLRYPDTLTSSGFPSVAATQELSFLRKSSEKRLHAKLVWTSTKGIVGPLVLLVLEQKLQERWREATRSDTVDFLLMWRQNTRVWVPINRI